MAVPAYNSGLIAFCESQGLAKVRRLRHVDNHFHSIDWDGVDRWLAVKEAERADESASNAAKALLISKRANTVAISAMILSAITAIIAAIIGVLFGK